MEFYQAAISLGVFMSFYLNAKLRHPDIGALRRFLFCQDFNMALRNFIVFFSLVFLVVF